MKITFFFKDGVNQKEIISSFEQHLDFAIDNYQPDYVICCGGDGTFLDAYNNYGSRPIYIGINLGTLGFYSSWLLTDIAQLVEDINNNKILYAPTLTVEVFDNDNKSIKYHCLNEATIINPITTLIIDVSVNGYHLEHFRGTGVCISTPTGSTAYNKSLSGSIISPSNKLFQLTHIAAINNTKYRSLENSIIFNEEEYLTLNCQREAFEDALLTIDRKKHHLNKVSKINISLSHEKAKILVPKENTFYKRVHEAFINREE